MNLLVKRIAILFSFASAILTTACDDPKEIGLPQAQSLGVFFTDTVTIRTSTVLVDSVITSEVVQDANGRFTRIGTSYLLAGKYANPTLGTVTAKSFFRPIFNNGAYSLGDAPTLDNLVLNIAYQYSYGDTNALHTLNIHQLTDSIRSDRTYYNFDEISVDPSPVGTVSFRPTPGRGDTLSIPLSAALGNKLVSLSGQNQADFIKSFFGVALVPAENDNASVVGYSLGRSYLRLNYRNGAEAKTYDFPLNGLYTAFNNIQSNRRGTPLELLQNPYNSIPSTATGIGNQTVIQSGVGIMTKIEIPHIKELQELGNVAINRAELIVTPTGANPPSVAQQLSLYEANGNGTIVRALSTGTLFPITDLIGVILTARLQNSSYTFDITSYLNQVLRGQRTNNGLFLSTPSTASNVGRTTPVVSSENSLEDSVVPVIIGAQNHPTAPIKLRIHYTPIGAN